MRLKRALLIVDLQNDFCPEGALAVPEGDEIVPVVNRYVSLFAKNKLPIFASRDWHPKKTRHFKAYGGQWPKHCVQNTKGAKFHPALKLPKEAIILSKGMDPDRMSYSVFGASDPNGTEFSVLLKIFGIERLFVCGLATDYCVKATVLDALKRGLKVSLLMDAIKGVNLRPRDSEGAIEEMARAGARKVTFKQTTGFIP